MSDTDDDDEPALPEPDPPPRPETPGSASWAQRADGRAPPYEETKDQIWAKWRARILAMEPEVREVHLEARRKRIARIAVRREEAARRVWRAS